MLDLKEIMSGIKAGANDLSGLGLLKPGIHDVVLDGVRIQKSNLKGWDNPTVKKDYEYEPYDALVLHMKGDEGIAIEQKSPYRFVKEEDEECETLLAKGADIDERGFVTLDGKRVRKSDTEARKSMLKLVFNISEIELKDELMDVARICAESDIDIREYANAEGEITTSALASLPEEVVLNIAYTLLKSNVDKTSYVIEVKSTHLGDKDFNSVSNIWSPDYYEKNIKTSDETAVEADDETTGLI